MCFWDLNFLHLGSNLGGGSARLGKAITVSEGRLEGLTTGHWAAGSRLSGGVVRWLGVQTTNLLEGAPTHHGSGLWCVNILDKLRYTWSGDGGGVKVGFGVEIDRTRSG